MKQAKTPERVAREALIDSIEKGDLIRLNGKLRVVRDLARHRDGRVRCLVFVIRRCSWTRRPTTTRTRTDLYNCELAVVKKGYGFGTDPLSIKLQRDIDLNLQSLTCCDVAGVIE